MRGGADGLRHALSLLPAVEEASDEEEQGEHEGQAGVRDGAQVQPEDAVDKPGRTSDEPYPRSFSHGLYLGRRWLPNRYRFHYT